MTISFLYWLIMVLMLLFGVWTYWPAEGRQPRLIGFSFILWLLLFLLGWKVFGFPLTGM